MKSNYVPHACVIDFREEQQTLVEYCVDFWGQTGTKDKLGKHWYRLQCGLGEVRGSLAIILFLSDHKKGEWGLGREVNHDAFLYGGYSAGKLQLWSLTT